MKAVLLYMFSVASLTIISTKRTIDALVGDSVECTCEFVSNEFSMFENPILWKKHQSHENTSINIMGNVLEPFLSTSRFEVTFLAKASRYQFALKIIRMYVWSWPT